MVKRKAEGLGDALSIEEPRRTSRRISKIATDKPKVKSKDEKSRQSKKRTTKASRESVEEANDTLDDATEEVGRIHFPRAKVEVQLNRGKYWTATITSIPLSSTG